MPRPGIHPWARIGGEPEDRNWHSDPNAPTYEPDVHPSARIEPFVSVDSGTCRATQVGERSWLFKHSHLGHDVIVGDDVEVSTGAVIGGSAEIGDGVKIGLNATILPYKKVGAGARIGAGAVVTKDVPPGEVWAGVPAKRMRAPDSTQGLPPSRFSVD